MIWVGIQCLLVGKREFWNLNRSSVYRNCCSSNGSNSQSKSFRWPITVLLRLPVSLIVWHCEDVVNPTGSSKCSSCLPISWDWNRSWIINITDHCVETFSFWHAPVDNHRCCKFCTNLFYREITFWCSLIPKFHTTSLLLLLWCRCGGENWFGAGLIAVSISLAWQYVIRCLISLELCSHF